MAGLWVTWWSFTITPQDRAGRVERDVLRGVLSASGNPGASTLTSFLPSVEVCASGL